MEEPYLYWLVRYVPDVARGEQVNVAVIVGRDGGDWAIRVVPNLRRASRLGGDASGLRPWLESIERSVHDYEHPPLALFARADAPTIGRAWLELLSHRFNNVLQVSAPAPVEAASAKDGVDFLYPALVASPTAAARSQTRTRMVQNLAELYVRTGSLELGSSLLRRPKARLGRQRGRFDFAVVDGRVDQLSQAFAFDVRDSETLEQELQSWNFIVSRLRTDGGVVLSGTSELPASEDVSVSAAYQEPRPGADARTVDVFEAALEAWQSLGVHAVPSTQLDRIAIEARELLNPVS
ncbi:hypothetical protein RS84_00076 [Microbacterium hydrocarbonoxydans]|jgi:hypothetical protein|uniref:DUF3037 domain-containing protein n=1 Tax=Microbacterium hydrocarbonoxydans TaxID=273678 RepID=A0A0M2HY53_9MICO|nr:DUF3037 domain-containing protein [Microbacterium hydrocarbonoxydans]KJL49368.1 hypothetical protein RS84_00076 [Microbacterium hydrocarbonoxydans]